LPGIVALLMCASLLAVIASPLPTIILTLGGFRWRRALPRAFYTCLVNGGEGGQAVIAASPAAASGCSLRHLMAIT